MPGGRSKVIGGNARTEALWHWAESRTEAGGQDRGWRPGPCRVASLPLLPFSLDEPSALVPCLVMEAQEESSNTKETWKMITAAGILSLYGNRQVPEKKNPDPRNSPGLLVPALGHLSIAAQVLAGQKPSFLLSLSSSAALLPSLCFFLSLSPSLPSPTSSSPSFLLCLCYPSALLFSLFSPFLSGSPPFSPVS